MRVLFSPKVTFEYLGGLQRQKQVFNNYYFLFQNLARML